MTNREIVIKCVERVEKNGLNFNEWYSDNINNTVDTYDGKIDILVRHPELFIFNKDFAKAFFGTLDYDYETLDVEIGRRIVGHLKNRQIAWQYHLQQVAIAENRFQYLKKFL